MNIKSTKYDTNDIPTVFCTWQAVLVTYFQECLWRCSMVLQPPGRTDATCHDYQWCTSESISLPLKELSILWKLLVFDNYKLDKGVRLGVVMQSFPSQTYSADIWCMQNKINHSAVSTESHCFKDLYNMYKCTCAMDWIWLLTMISDIQNLRTLISCLSMLSVIRSD